MSPTDTPDAIPETFQSQVRDALMHLYDYAYLVRHPLVETLVPPESRTSAGHALRNIVLDAIEELHPDPSIPRGTRGWRPYDILMQRFVDGFGVEDILESLHISLRQFQRDQRRALQAVASILWQRRLVTSTTDIEVAGTPAHPAEDEASRLAAEVERMGLRLEAVQVEELVRNAVSSVMPLARARGGDVTIVGGPPAQAMVDRDLARQALVAALSTPLNTVNCTLRVAWFHEQDGVGVSISADLPLAARKAVRERLLSMGELLDNKAAGYRLARERIEPWRLTLHLLGEGADIMLVDDDSRLRQLYTRYLEAEGFRSRAVASAQEALQALESSVPALIILDVMMRDMDGWQLLQLIKSRPDAKRTPVIVCSVLNEPDLAQALGARCYLRKPISPQDLVAAVHQALSEPDSQKSS